MISCDEKKYSSNTSDRTEENNRVNNSLSSHDVLLNNLNIEWVLWNILCVLVSLKNDCYR